MHDKPTYARALPESTEKWADNADGWEAIGTMPDLLLPDGKVPAGLDQGEARLYTLHTQRHGEEQAPARAPVQQKARVDWFASTTRTSARSRRRPRRRSPHGHRDAPASASGSVRTRARSC